MEELKRHKELGDLTRVQLETERLSLVSVAVEYAPLMLAELTDEVTKNLSFYPPRSLEEELTFVTQSRKDMENGDKLALAILDKQTEEYLGGVGIHNLGTRTPELGVWLKKAAHGKKIGREAIVSLKRWADENLDYDYLIYPVHKENIASQKIPQSLGGTIAETKVITFPSGKQMDSIVYHIPKSQITG